MKTRGFKKARKLVQSDAAQKILNILVCCALVLQTSPLAYARPGEETPEQQQEVVLQEEAPAQDPAQETEGTTDEQNAPTVPEETSAENTAPQATDGLQESTDPAPTAPVQGQPAANTQQTFIHEDGSLRVTATLSDPSALPAGVVFRVKRVTSDTRGYSYNAYMQALNDRAREQAQAEGVSVDEAPVYTPDNTMLYDAGFFMKDANGTWVEVQLASGTVNLTFEFKRDQLSEGIGAADAQDIEVVHLPLVPEVRDAVASTAQATQASAEDVVVEAPVAGSVAVDAASDTASFALTSLSMIAVGAANAPAGAGESVRVYVRGYFMASSYGNNSVSPSIKTQGRNVTFTAGEPFGFENDMAFGPHWNEERQRWTGGLPAAREVHNPNTGTYWTCAGFVPTRDDPTNADTLYRTYCFGSEEDAAAYLEAHGGIVYGEVPTDEQLAEAVSKGVMTIWYETKVEGVEPHDYGNLMVTGAHQVPYEATSDGITVTAEASTEELPGGHYVSVITYTYTIPEGYDKDEIVLDTLDGDAGTQTHQPGDEVFYKIHVIDQSGNEYEYVSGAMGTYISTDDGFSEGFEGYGITSYIKNPRTGNDLSSVARRGMNSAIITLYDLAGLSGNGRFERTLREYYGVYDSAPTDDIVGASLYRLGYGDTIVGADGTELPREDAIAGLFDENYDNTFQPIAVSCLDDYYLDYFNAIYQSKNGGEGKHYTSVTQVGEEDPTLLISLFSDGDGTEIEETNPSVANMLYYTFYNFLFPARPDTDSEYEGLYDIMKPETNKYDGYFRTQWTSSLAEDETTGTRTHDLGWFSLISGENDNAMQNTFFGVAAQVKLKRSIKISLNKYYAGSDAQEGMFNFLVSPANENFEVETGGTQSKTATNGAFDETTHIAPVSQTIDCSEKKVYYYVISEQNPNQALRDPAEILVKVDNTVEKGPKITYAIREANGTVGEFSETLPTLYNNSKIKVAGRARKLRGATNFTAYQPEIRKVLEYGTLKGDDFNFSLYEGTKVDESKLLDTETNDVTGKVAFAAMNFGDGDVGKTFTYTIVENAPAGATTNDDGQVVSQGIVYTQDQVRLTLEVTRDKEGNIKVEDTYELISAETGEASETDDPCLVNTYEQVVVLAHKYTRVDGKADKSMPLVGAHYQLYMVNPGGADIALTEGRNQLEVEGCRYESAEDGSLYYDIPLVEGVAYYFKELDPPPAGHLVDPYPTDYFTLVRTDDGFKLVYESEFGSTEEFLAYVESINS